MDTNSGIPTYLTVWGSDKGFKMHIQFVDSDVECVIPISEGQHKMILDSINKNFLGGLPESPADDELGILSGIRFMAPMDRMNAIYSSPDRFYRVIMVNIDPINHVITFHHIANPPDKKVLSFDVPVEYFKAANKYVDFGTTEILQDGKLVKFGEYQVNSKELIAWFAGIDK